MRIISPFTDYYDSIQYYGQDQNVLFLRSSKEHEMNNDFYKYFLNNEKYQRKYGAEYTRGEILIRLFKIGFCGQLYSGLKIYRDYQLEKILYSLNEYTEYMTANFENFTHKFGWYWFFGNNFQDWFNIKHADFEDFCIKNKYSIIVYDSILNEKNHSIVENACLKDYQFFRIKDSFKAFQELDMWISGVLGSNAPKAVEIEDKYKLVEHGFDKWSFKKRP